MWRVAYGLNNADKEVVICSNELKLITTLFKIALISMKNGLFALSKSKFADKPKKCYKKGQKIAFLVSWLKKRRQIISINI
jgi:hypothetical protein